MASIIFQSEKLKDFPASCNKASYMKIFSLFRRNAKGENAVGATGSLSSRDKSQKTTKTNRSSRAEKGSSIVQPESAVPEVISSTTDGTGATSMYIEAAHNWMDAMNTYIPDDPEAFMARITGCYETEDSPVILEDGERYKAKDCSGLFYLTHLSFPDFVMKYDTNVAEKTGFKDGIKFVEVTIDAMYATGTHTGAPYSIIPGQLPAVPTSGKYVENDEQRISLLFNEDGKITQTQVIAMGTHTGFAGFYTRAGGTIPM